MKWISIDNRLPLPGQAVLVALYSGIVTVAYRKTINGKKTWQLYGPIQDICDIDNDYITHWMPLPKSPIY